MINTLKEMLGYEIEPSKLYLYKIALTHNSYQNEIKSKENYQRQEWLGDSIVNMLTTEFLFKYFPKKTEGELTNIRIMAVRQETLARAAKEIGLDNFILLGKGEEKTGGRQKETIMGDVFESFCAAIFMDKGFDATRYFLNKTVFKYIRNDDFAAVMDHKTKLQELLQDSSPSSIVYKLDDQNKEKEFIISVYNNNIKLGTGKGLTKKEAEQKAAKKALEKCCSGDK